MERRFMRLPRAVLGAFASAALGLLLSCGSPTVQVLSGNYRHSKGDYAQATVNYFQALESLHRRPYVQYDLGNVYRALGEEEVANEAFLSSIEESVGGELLFRAFFNLGHISYENDDYRQAVHYFVEALRVDPDDWDAKINLELALRNLSQEPDRQSEPQGQSAVETGSLEESFQDILDTIEKREEMLWRSAIPQPTETTGNDW
jgi:tetratricopeptide (TPR) repeat protein